MRRFIETERKQLLLLTNVSLETVALVGSAVKNHRRIGRSFRNLND